MSKVKKVIKAKVLNTGLELSEKFKNLTDSEIDTSDIPELGKDFWDNAKIARPGQQKICSAKNCYNMHATKYKMCEVCRKFQREDSRKSRQSRVQKIIYLCEKHSDTELSKEILKLFK